MYNILPFIEQSALHDYGRGATGLRGTKRPASAWNHHLKA